MAIPIRLSNILSQTRFYIWEIQLSHEPRSLQEAQVWTLHIDDYHETILSSHRLLGCVNELVMDKTTEGEIR